MSIKSVFRDAISHLFASQSRAAWSAACLRPLLRWSSGTWLYPPLWGLAEQTINLHGPKVSARTWFGCILHGRLGTMLDQYVFYTRVWEPEISRFFRHWLKPGDTVADIGANVGYFSLLSSRLVGTGGAVIAVEPWPETVTRLRQTIDDNLASNVSILPLAITDYEGRVTLYAGPPGNIGETSLTENAPGARQASAPCARLAHVLRSVDIQRLSLIKIDIEGAEPAALRDVLAVAAELPDRVAVVVELTPSELRRANWPIQQLIAAFSDVGFRAFRIRNEYDLTPDWWRFDPRPLPMLFPLGKPPDDRFDAVFVRGDTIIGGMK